MIIIQYKNKVLRSIVMTFIIWTLPLIAHATEIDTSIAGYSELLNSMRIYVRGAGAIVLMIGSADFFISLSNEHSERLVRAMQIIGAGFFLILADSFVQTIGNANGTQAIQVLANMIGMMISFIGAVLSMLGAYRTMNSIKERNADVRSKAIKLLISGLMLVAISQSVSKFFL